MKHSARWSGSEMNIIGRLVRKKYGGRNIWTILHSHTDFQSICTSSICPSEGIYNKEALIIKHDRRSMLLNPWEPTDHSSQGSRLVSSLAIVREAFSCSRWEQIQRTIARHYSESTRSRNTELYMGYHHQIPPYRIKRRGGRKNGKARWDGRHKDNNGL